MVPIPEHYAKARARASAAAGVAATPTTAGVAANRNNNNATKSAPSQQKKIGAFDGRARRTKDGHNGSVKKWDQFASINKYPQFYALTQEQVCGQVYSNGSMANPENPPLRQMFAEFVQYLLDYKKSGKDDEDEEADILAGDDDDDDEDDEEEEEVQTAREPCNGLKP